MLRHTLQNWFASWKHSAEKFYHVRLTHQTWLLPIDLGLAEQYYGSCEDVKKWFDEWFATKAEDFY